LFERVATPVQKAIENAEISLDVINQVILFGGATRAQKATLFGPMNVLPQKKVITFNKHKLRLHRLDYLGALNIPTIPVPENSGNFSIVDSKE
jgi:Hsp70 protein